jgi:hypothetical protein
LASSGDRNHGAAPPAAPAADPSDRHISHAVSTAPDYRETLAHDVAFDVVVIIKHVFDSCFFWFTHKQQTTTVLVVVVVVVVVVTHDVGT